jgi:hypothetical protein
VIVSVLFIEIDIISFLNIFLYYSSLLNLTISNKQREWNNYNHEPVMNHQKCIFCVQDWSRSIGDDLFFLCMNHYSFYHSYILTFQMTLIFIMLLLVLSHLKISKRGIQYLLPHLCISNLIQKVQWRYSSRWFVWFKHYFLFSQNDR